MPNLRRGAAPALLSLLAVLAAVAPAAAAPLLRPDPSFGRHGVAEPGLAPHYDYTSFRSLNVQPDGSILTARHDGGNGEGFLTYRRYDAAGHLDRSFEPKSETPPVEALTADGKVLRANTNSIERFNPDGSRDLSYGTDPANGRPFSEILNFRIEELLLTPSGKLFVAGSILDRKDGEESVQQIVVVRLDAQGRFDPGFGGDGTVKLRSETGVLGAGLVGVAGRGEEGIVVLVDEAERRRYEGDGTTPGGSAVVALAANGLPDPGYGDGGSVRSPSSIEAFATLPDGSLVVAGNRWGELIRREGARTSDIYAARLTPSGHYDPGFDGDGVATVGSGGIDLTGALLLGDDGSILIGGASTELVDSKCVDYEGFCRETPVLLRLLPDGAPDPGFGADGKVRLGALSDPFVEPDVGRGVRVLTALPGGGVLAGGGSGTAAFIAELDSRGALAPGFGSGGVVIERDAGWTETEAHAVAIDSRDRILVAGSTESGRLYSAESGAVFRFRPDGRPDRSYGEGAGYVRVPGNTRDIAVGPRGDAYVLSGEFGPNIVVHLTARGAVDRGFGQDGVAPLPDLPAIRRHGKRHGQEFDPRSIVALPGGGALVGGEAGSNADTRIVLARFDRHGGLVRRFGDDGVALLALGRTGKCNMTQLRLGTDGRILIAGRVRERGENGRRPALFRLLADGSPDPSFGRRGVAQVDLGAEGVATSLAIGGDGSILLAGRRETDRKTTPLLFRFSRNGTLDRGFARRMLASAPSFRRDEGLAARQILPTASGIFTVAPYRAILGFSDRGSFRGAQPFKRGKKPRHYLRAGAVQRGRPLLVGEIGEGRGLVLRRYLMK